METMPGEDLSDSSHPYSLALGRSYPGLETIARDLGGIRGDAFYRVATRTCKNASAHNRTAPCRPGPLHENGHGPPDGCLFRPRCTQAVEECGRGDIPLSAVDGTPDSLPSQGDCQPHGTERRQQAVQNGRRPIPNGPATFGPEKSFVWWVKQVPVKPPWPRSPPGYLCPTGVAAIRRPGHGRMDGRNFRHFGPADRGDLSKSCRSGQPPPFRFRYRGRTAPDSRKLKG